MTFLNFCRNTTRGKMKYLEKTISEFSSDEDDASTSLNSPSAEQPVFQKINKNWRKRIINGHARNQNIRA
jgi:hypothetical protein